MLVRVVTNTGLHQDDIVWAQQHLDRAGLPATPQLRQTLVTGEATRRACES